MTAQPSQPETYQLGHHHATTALHMRRTAENEGAFVLPYLKPYFNILDLGCGPGTIASSFAKYVPEGTVTGIDLTTEVIGQAKALLAQMSPVPNNVTFRTGNVLEGLPFEDETFDVVYCGQVMSHIYDPVQAITEARRVLKPGGIFCDREGDCLFRWMPYLRGLQIWQKYCYWMIIGKPENPRDPEYPDQPPFGSNHRSGSLIHKWARLAGFSAAKMIKGAKVAVNSSPEERELAARLMYQRLVQQTGQREKFKELGATDEDIELMISDLKKWAADVDGWQAIIHCEVVCEK